MLRESNVIFNQEQHTYLLDGVLLSGITGMIKKQLFPDKYNGIPEAILHKAAERGSAIHEACELFDRLGVIPDFDEVSSYAALIKDNNLEVLESEYIVTDGETFATAIDKVFSDYSLADLKTTYTLDKEYVTWQLSIDAYFFELLNPDKKVNKLYAIWLRGTSAQLVELERIEDKYIVELLACEREGRQFVNPFAVTTTDSLPRQYADMEQHLIDINEQLSLLQAEQDKLKEALLKAMEDNNITKWTTSRLTITRKKATTTEKFDSKRFKEENPEVYKEYTKTSSVKSSLLIKIQ